MRERGFTLVEVLVVASITVFITGILVANFSRSRTDLNQTALTVIDAVREAQALTLAGSLVQGSHRCGFGIHFMADGYIIYAGPSAALTDCTAQDRNYNAGTDTIIRQALLTNNALEFAAPFTDIFFEPPDPTTYIGGFQSPNGTRHDEHRHPSQGDPMQRPGKRGLPYYPCLRNRHRRTIGESAGSRWWRRWLRSLC
jgi:type II secretory pathway pseudopilin PulG